MARHDCMPALKDDPYKVLGVAPSVSDAELKCVYHHLSLQIHPDKDHSRPKAESTARFQRLKSAYELLSDPARRRDFDAVLGGRRSTVVAQAAPSATCARSAGCLAAKKRKAGAGAPRSRKARTCPVVEVMESDVEVFDSGEEDAARNAEWEAAEAVRNVHARRRRLRAAEQARREQARHEEEPKAAAKAAGPQRSHVRLKLRGGLAPRLETDDIQQALLTFHCRVLSADAAHVVVSVESEARAVACVLSFHGWQGRACTAAEVHLFSRVSVVTGPVSREGHALAGSQATVTATQSKIVYCDRGGATSL